MIAVTNAVEAQKMMLSNVKNATKNYSKYIEPHPI